ncbi:hypothetical protein HMPREF0554_0530 [Pseudoleptotrichia goodfellowii F0264]|uniref:Uncharacterized protein n=1 Tax=Pseudoleptotrichia goodfellowii F0264 TaxID=596323 RepID=D0GNL9_9FUSO|nr:hypothetical protein HMPREF0554_0530 [Pseudoleptotrichia goodfellowii F0264]
MIFIKNIKKVRKDGRSSKKGLLPFLFENTLFRHRQLQF